MSTITIKRVLDLRHLYNNDKNSSYNNDDDDDDDDDKFYKFCCLGLL